MKMPAARPLPDDINPDALISFPLPEAYDPSWKGFDIIVAAFATREYGFSPPDRQQKQVFFDNAMYVMLI